LACSIAFLSSTLLASQAMSNEGMMVFVDGLIFFGTADKRR
jgi:hypothetical protein